jgi:hypothetical protein
MDENKFFLSTVINKKKNLFLKKLKIENKNKIYLFLFQI